MNNTSICIICENTFPYRKGKLYCSDSCKTKAYNIKKSGVYIAGLGESVSLERTTFYLSDYKIFENKNSCTFQEYAFLIKNFSDLEDPFFMNDYVNEIVQTDNFYEDIRNNLHPIRKKYLNFIERFHDGYYKIKKERPTQEIENN